jgi:hypothetical protein
MDSSFFLEHLYNWCSIKKSVICIVVFNDIRAVSVVFNMLLQIVHTNS